MGLAIWMRLEFGRGPLRLLADAVLDAPHLCLVLSLQSKSVGSGETGSTTALTSALTERDMFHNVGT